MSLIGLGIVYVSLLLLLAVVSALETAIHSVREVEGKEFSSEKNLGESALERRLRNIRQNPFVQLQQTLLLSAGLNLSLALLILYAVSGPMREQGLRVWVWAPILFGTMVLVGDALPKFFAVNRSADLLVIGSRLLVPVRAILDPLARLAEWLADRILGRIVPARVKVRSFMTRDEFETLVEMRQEQAVLTRDESAIIREVLDLEALIVRDAIVPRVDLPLVSLSEGDEPVTAFLERAGGRFVVVHADTPDVVEGVVDALAWKLEGRPPWREVMRPPVFVPETMAMLNVLARHLPDASSVVLVVDEYGGLEGLVSQEEIADWLLHEAAPWLGEDAEVRELEPGRYVLDGGARLDHIQDETGVALAPEEAEGIDTIGGLVFKLLGHVPKAGERLKIGAVQVKVRRMARARVKQVELWVPVSEDEAKEAGN
jgi:CBS domain containing-hemolysin-like protein